MITFKNELPIDHTKSLEAWVDVWTKELQEENKALDMATGWDTCNHYAWLEMVWWLEDGNLEMIR